MKLSGLLLSPLALSDIWDIIFSPCQAKNKLSTIRSLVLTKPLWTEHCDKRKGWGATVIWKALLVWSVSRWLVTACAFCRRMTIYRSALKSCSKSLWSSTEKSEIAFLILFKTADIKKQDCVRHSLSFPQHLASLSSRGINGSITFCSNAFCFNNSTFSNELYLSLLLSWYPQGYIFLHH